VAEQRKIQSRLERYASPAVVARVIQTTSTAGMIAEQRVVTVLFADLVGFTSMSETRTPTEVAELLNGVFDRLTDAVFEHEGTLDKYMGDGMMAFFGAPSPDPQHALKAARAAWDMQLALTAINQEQGLQPPVRMRVGLNTGSVIVGDIGSRKRRDYTVVGDTVNVASRLEGVAKPGQVVIGEATREAIGDAFELELLEPVQVKGRTEPVVPARLVAPR
jgi:adenylate cyclase